MDSAHLQITLNMTVDIDLSVIEMMANTRIICLRIEFCMMDSLYTYNGSRIILTTGNKTIVHMMGHAGMVHRTRSTGGVRCVITSPCMMIDTNVSMNTRLLHEYIMSPHTIITHHL